MKIFLVMAVVTETKVTIGNLNPIVKDIKLSWSDGMIGVVPIFSNKEDAEKYAETNNDKNQKYNVMEMETEE